MLIPYSCKLSQIRPKIIFTELIFANFIIQPFCTVLFIISQILFLRISKNHEKSESYWPRKFPGYTVLKLFKVLGLPILIVVPLLYHCR